MTTIFIRFCRFFYITSHQNLLIPQAPPQMTYLLWFLYLGYISGQTGLIIGNFLHKSGHLGPKMATNYFFKNSLKTTIKIKLRALGIRSLSFLVHFLQPSHLCVSKFQKMSVNVKNSHFFKNWRKLKKISNFVRNQGHIDENHV